MPCNCYYGILYCGERKAAWTFNSVRASLKVLVTDGMQGIINAALASRMLRKGFG